MRLAQISFTLCVAFLASGCISLPDTVDLDLTLPTVELNGYRFHAETFGDPRNPVVIVLHGGPGADYRYLYPLKALADDYFVVFYDQRGTGLSPRVPEAQITIQGFVDDLDAFVSHFGQGRSVSLIGHSWGAMLGSAYVGAHPHKVNKIVLAEPQFLDATTLDALPMGGWPGARVIWGVTKAWFGKWRVQPNGDRYARDDFFLGQLILVMQAPEELCNGELPPLEAWRFGSPNFDATVGRMMDDPDSVSTLNFAKGVEAFEGETLFLSGECNEIVGAEHQKRHLGYFRNAKLEVVPAAGHFMFNDRPAYTTSVLKSFLSDALVASNPNLATLQQPTQAAK